MPKIKPIITTIFIILLLLGTRHWINNPRLSFIVDTIHTLPTKGKLLALTFDDGPHPKATPLLLDLLKKVDIKAAFFVNGNKLELYPSIAKRIVSEGHQLINHSFQHEPMIFKSFDYIEKDFLKTDSLIKAAGQQQFKFYRPPYGQSFINLPRVLKKYNRTILNWSIASGSQYEIPFPKEKIIAETTAGFHPGGIILLHDGYDSVDAVALAEAVEKIIEYARKENYLFVPLHPMN